MKKILIISFALFANTVCANSIITDLKVDPKETEEFKKPLPELFIFNSKNECLYKSSGFANEEDLFINLDYLFGISNEVLPGRIVKSKFAADFKKMNPSIESLPKEQQEKIISESLEGIASQIVTKTCPIKINQIYATLLNTNGKSFKPPNNPESQFTIIEFSADWCVPCKQLEVGLNKYISARSVSIGWLKVERDGQKIANEKL